MQEVSEYDELVEAGSEAGHISDPDDCAGAGVVSDAADCAARSLDAASGLPSGAGRAPRFTVPSRAARDSLHLGGLSRSPLLDERGSAPWLGFAMGMRELVAFDALSGARLASYPLALDVLQLEWLAERCVLAARVSEGADERVLGFTLAAGQGALELRLDYASEPRRGPAWLVRAGSALGAEGSEALWLAHDAVIGWQALDWALEPTGPSWAWPAPHHAVKLTQGWVGVQLGRGAGATLGVVDLSLAAPALERRAMPHLVGLAAGGDDLWLWFEPPGGEPVLERRRVADLTLLSRRALPRIGALGALAATRGGVVAAVHRGGAAWSMYFREENDAGIAEWGRALGPVSGPSEQGSSEPPGLWAPQGLAAEGHRAWFAGAGGVTQVALPDLTPAPGFQGAGLTAPLSVPAPGAARCAEP